MLHLEAGVLERVVLDAQTNLHTHEGVQATVTQSFCASTTTHTWLFAEMKYAQDVLLDSSSSSISP
jgi:hypothetical protein